MRLPPVLTRNWPLKLTSLFLAVVLWLLAAGEEPASRLVTAELRVRPPEGRDVVRAPGTVAVAVVGPARELLKLSASRLIITRLLPDTLSTDSVTLALSPSDVELPPDVRAQVQDVQPRSVRILLDVVDAREVPVAVRLAPAEPRPAGLGTDPPTVRLVGPAAALTQLDSAHTEPLTAAQLRAPFGFQAAIDTAGMGPVRAVPRRVTVTVGGEPTVERDLPAVPVQLAASLAAGYAATPTSVRVRLSGPAGRVAVVDPRGVFAIADGTPPSAGGALRLRLVVPPGISATADPATVQVLPRGTP